MIRKFLKFLEDEHKKNPEDYLSFYHEYHMFLKQGVCQDYKFMDTLSKLIMFESSAKQPNELITFDDYISRCPPEQKEIYYLSAPSREAALSSPYYEAFKRNNREVLLLYNTVDDFVMNNIRTYSGRNLISAETSSIKFDDKDEPKAEEGQKTKLTEQESKDLGEWFRLVLGDKRVREVRATQRLSDSPAIVTDHQSGALRRMMRMVESANNKANTADLLPPQIFEFNPSHPVIVELFESKDNPNGAAPLVAEQLFDNALMAAGLLEDPRSMLPRLNELLLKSMKRDSSEPGLPTNHADPEDEEKQGV